MSGKYDEMRKWISVLYRQFPIYISNNIKDLDISVSEYHFLIVLFKFENLSQDDLSKILIIDKAATARAIKSLEEKNYILRVKDSKDKRTNRITLTDDGNNLKERLSSYIVEWGDTLTEGIDVEKLDLVIDIIQLMALKSIKQNEI